MENKISVGDWITFLGNEKSWVISAMISIGAFLVGIFAVIISVAAPGLWRLFGIGIFVAYLLYWYLQKDKRPNGQDLYRKGKLAESILDKIMEGKIIEPEIIQKEWVFGLELIYKSKI
jgi:hypothetical protein